MVLGVKGFQLKCGSKVELARKLFVQVSQCERSACLASLLGVVRLLFVVRVIIIGVLLDNRLDLCREEILFKSKVDVLGLG